MKNLRLRFLIGAAGLVLTAACADLTAPPQPARVSAPAAAATAVPGGVTVCSGAAGWQFSWDNVHWQPPVVAWSYITWYTNPGYPPPGQESWYPQPTPGSLWVTAYPELDSPFPRDTAYFKFSFDIPTGATNVSLTGTMAARSQGTVLLNGTQIYQQDYYEGYENYQNVQFLSDFSGTGQSRVGSNDILLQVMHKKDTGELVADWCVTATWVAPPPPPPPAPPPPPGSTPAALVRHAPSFSGATAVTGPIELLAAEDISISGDSRVEKLLVPGVPSMKISKQASVATIQDGTGAATPTDYSLSVTGKGVLSTLVRRTNPVAMPTLTAARTSTGTKNISITQPRDPLSGLIDWSTAKNISLSGKAGVVAISPGAYGNLSVSGSNTVLLGQFGASTPTLYDFQSVSLSGKGSIQVIGPVIITVAGQVTVSGGSALVGSPDQVTLHIVPASGRHDDGHGDDDEEEGQGGLSVTGGSSVTGVVLAPSGSIEVSGQSTFQGGLAANRLSVTGGSTLSIIRPTPVH